MLVADRKATNWLEEVSPSPSSFSLLVLSLSSLVVSAFLLSAVLCFLLTVCNARVSTIITLSSIPEAYFGIISIIVLNVLFQHNALTNRNLVLIRVTSNKLILYNFEMSHDDVAQ